MWTNPVDKLPQVPVDWANHVIYGGAIGLLTLLVIRSSLWATVFVLLLGAAKKLVDYFKEKESVQMCVGKTLVGAVWPASMLLAHSLGLF